MQRKEMSESAAGRKGGPEKIAAWLKARVGHFANVETAG